ncbi:50S ribosomal protein L10 [Candidatus Woesearchaeota archaeon]|nr:50S ribosomal protein L10 [Candidatus Woesearchaeota archaeon]
MAHVSQQKKDTVSEFVELIDKYDYVGAVNMENLPAKTLYGMRTKLRDSVLIRMTKRRLITVALKNSKKEGVDKLIPHLKGMPALLFTNESPFTLFKTLKKNKSTAAIKGGQVAPNDIVVPAGPTGFAPGPVIGELGSVGIRAGIDGGKVAIKADAVVAKEGDVVNAKLAALLTRLGIEPMEIGLDLTAVYENGEILTKAVLDIDEDAYINDIGTAASWAFNLAVNAAIPNAQSIEALLQKAFGESRNLAINEDILTDITVGDTLAKVYGQMMAVASLLPEEALSEELKGAASAAASAAATPAASAPADNDKKDEPEEPKADAAAGLGALFG